MSTVVVRCLLINDEKERRGYAFKISIRTDEEIEDLTEKVKEKQPDDLKGIGTNRLTVWKLCVPLSYEEIENTDFLGKVQLAPTDADIKNRAECALRLYSGQEIGDGPWPKGMVHILVQLPDEKVYQARETNTRRALPDDILAQSIQPNRIRSSTAPPSTVVSALQPNQTAPIFHVVIPRPEEYSEAKRLGPPRKRVRTNSEESTFSIENEANNHVVDQNAQRIAQKAAYHLGVGLGIKHEERDVDVDRLHTEVYLKAWGRRWPYQAQREIKLDCEMGYEGQIQVQDRSESALHLEDDETSWKYTSLGGIMRVGNLLGMTTGVRRNLVVRDEYEWILNTLETRIDNARDKERGTPHFVLLGQPGIGKTTFLLYLLLRRLEKRLPTAIQVGSKKYTLFDANGVATFCVADVPLRLTPECWALCDSNSIVATPCEAFLRTGGPPVIQATSARENRWKDWAKQKSATRMIVELPRTVEIAAIAREDNYDPVEAVNLVREWGPTTRTVMDILDDPGLEQAYEQGARTTAITVARNTSNALYEDIDKLDGKASAILFLRPYREPHPRFGVMLYGHVLYIPTPRLAEYMDEARARISNNEALALFSALSSHSITRNAAGWKLEKQMHACMCSGGDPLNLEPEGHIQPATKLLSGILASLKTVGGLPGFYWVPSVSNFEGLDGVLGYQENIYALQATIFYREKW